MGGVVGFDVSTRAARRALDERVAAALSRDQWVDRTSLAADMRCADARGRRLVSASLKRGVRDGWAEVQRRGAWTRYRRCT